MVTIPPTAWWLGQGDRGIALQSALLLLRLANVTGSRHLSSPCYSIVELQSQYTVEAPGLTCLCEALGQEHRCLGSIVVFIVIAIWLQYPTADEASLVLRP